MKRSSVAGEVAGHGTTSSEEPIPTQHFRCPAKASYGNQCPNATYRPGQLCTLCTRKPLGVDHMPNPEKYVTAYYEKVYCRTVTQRGKKWYLCCQIRIEGKTICKYHLRKDEIVAKVQKTKRENKANKKLKTN